MNVTRTRIVKRTKTALPFNEQKVTINYIEWRFCYVCAFLNNTCPFILNQNIFGKYEEQTLLANLYPLNHAHAGLVTK